MAYQTNIDTFYNANFNNFLILFFRKEVAKMRYILVFKFTKKNKKIKSFTPVGLRLMIASHNAFMSPHCHLRG